MSAQILHISTVHGALDGRIYYKEVRSLHDAGFDVAIAGTRSHHSAHNGVRIIPLGAREGPRWKRLLRDFRAMSIMLASPKSIHHIHDPDLLLAAFVPAYLGRKVVYDVHEFYRERIGDSDWIPGPLRAAISHAYEFIERAVLRRFGGVVIVSEAMRERYASIVGDQRVALVRSFPYLSAQEFEAARTRPHPLGGQRYILHTGGASRHRAFETMVNVAERLRAAGCTWPIINVGPVDLSGYGPAAGDLLKRAEQADVRNLGLQSQEAAWWYVAHASVGYMPLINIDNNVRGMPNKLFENLLFGLPMVGMNVGNIAATINETGAGLLVAPEDAQGHAVALLRLVNEDALRERLAANARAASSHYSFDGELQRLIALYERIDSRVQPIR